MAGNLIFTAFASMPATAAGSQNLKKTADQMQIYFENIAVTLVSAKHYNPSDTVALITTMEKAEIPSWFADLCERKNILILRIPFDTFTFPDAYTWSFCFYRACVLEHLLDMEYDRFCSLDADMYIQGSFAGIFAEADQHVLLYDLNHGLAVADYQRLMKEVENWYGKPVYLTQYGGEFVACSRAYARLFIAQCKKVYERMSASHMVVSTGDEFMYAIAARECGAAVKNAGGYVYRFWTRTFRLVATSYAYNAVAVLHVPSEKARGMRKLYRRYIAEDRIPPRRSVWRICHFTHSSLRDSLGRIYLRMRQEKI